MSIKFSCVTLRHMSFTGRVVLPVTFQEVDAAPHAQAAARAITRVCNTSIALVKKSEISTSFLQVFQRNRFTRPCVYFIHS